MKEAHALSFAAAGSAAITMLAMDIITALGLSPQKWYDIRQEARLFTGLFVSLSLSLYICTELFQMDESLSDTYGYSECSGQPCYNVSCVLPESCEGPEARTLHHPYFSNVLSGRVRDLGFFLFW